MSKKMNMEELSAYLDGEARDPDAVRNALQSDPALARRYMQLAKLSTHLKALPLPNVHPAFTTRVMAHVREAKPAPARSWFQWVMSAVVAGLIVVAGGTAYLISRFPNDAVDEAQLAQVRALAQMDTNALTEKLVAQLVENPEALAEIDEPISLESLGSFEDNNETVLDSQPYVERLAEAVEDEGDLEVTLTTLSQSELRELEILLLGSKGEGSLS